MQQVRRISSLKCFILILEDTCWFRVRVLPVCLLICRGIWNPYIRPPWSSNYTTNINVEGKLLACWNLQFIRNASSIALDLLRMLRKQVLLRLAIFYGCKGWCLAHNSDYIWAMVILWGILVKVILRGRAGIYGTWISTHLWEHYQFTMDKWVSSTETYPLMKRCGQVLFAMVGGRWKKETLLLRLTSPENKYVAPDGFIGSTLYGATADLAMIRTLFSQVLMAAKILKVDDAFSDSVGSALSHLYPYRIGRDGSLQEWYHDWSDEDPKHRHQSHLFGLYPGQHISPWNHRTGTSVACGFGDKGRRYQVGQGWRINLWARLWDGNRTL